MFLRRGICSRLLCTFVALSFQTIARADGGRVVAEKSVDDYRIVLFANPSPLRAGMADLSVFIEQDGKRAPVLDAVVAFRLNKLSRPTPELAWKGTGCVTPGQSVNARLGHTGNGLLYSAVLGIPEPGLWSLGVSIDPMGKTSLISFEVPVERALRPMQTMWPFVAILPIAIFLYAWRGFLLRKRRSK